MSKDALLELADRVDGMSEGSRELDAAIFEAIGLTELQELHCKDWCRQNGRTDLTRERYVSAWAPDFTRSLDAAMTLVPEGFLWIMDSWSARGWSAGLWKSGSGRWSIDASRQRQQVTPALALTAAALRARAQQESKDA